MQQWIKEVARGKKGSRDLTYQEAMEAASAVIAGKATDAQLAAFLIAERVKTESAYEVLAFVKRLRENSTAIPVSASVRRHLLDLAGPYTGRNTFAATIPVAVLMAESGIPVYLHGSDSLPPKYGTSLKEILAGLGIAADLAAEQIADSIETLGIGFAWTEKLSPPLYRMRKVRLEIGVRTLLNTAEKNLNLAGAHAVMAGVFHKTVVDMNAAVLQRLGYQKTFIVQGAEGSEDLPNHRPGFIYEATEDGVRSWIVDPEDYGLKHKKDPERQMLALEHQVELIRRILEGEVSAELQDCRDQVLLNAGVRYHLLGKTSSIREGIELAAEQLMRGKGASFLEAWTSYLRKNEGERGTTA
ncbi:anthranilate phosphoribosyltransferase [Ferviditalea candida]|uniref:Anthranilate phosphoribosyltransferase n=1 Tax=Ferviditalea candida TaxID=3108399 RepID=A0ABU5ZH18_9BACL|nr:anthranilate phosphoribosyltransferase [Paenibacillaceae bacterium T2]